MDLIRTRTFEFQLVLLNFQFVLLSFQLVTRDLQYHTPDFLTANFRYLATVQLEKIETKMEGDTFLY